MSRRRRWTPVRGTGNRIYEPWERLAVAALDWPVRAAFGAGRMLGFERGPGPLDPAAVREVLVLRVDRIGDVLMALPALADLRAALPRARIRLAVGAWSRAVAESAPVDEVLEWSAPWVGRASEGASSLAELARRARALRSDALDLALDLQGDFRAAWLMRLTGARHRVGYANTGGAALLTRVVPLDETVSWVEQNRRTVAAALGIPAGAAIPDPLRDDDRAFARRLLENLSLTGRRPLVGLHPSGGRTVKQWDAARWVEVAARAQRHYGATVLVTGAAADAALTGSVARELRGRVWDVSGRLSVRETMALVSELDLFLSPDTGPMHMACAVGTRSVAVFGPSDPVRYFSGGDPTGAPGARHVVVRRELWCAPCNLIRRPPAECAGDGPPECLRLVSVDDVWAAAERLLRDAGFARRERHSGAREAAE